jgi:serine O-acetyltransferase
MLKELKMDAARWIIPEQVGDPSKVTLRKLLALLYQYPPLQAVMLFRFGNWCQKKHIPLAGFVQRLVAVFYGLEILIGAEIGGGLYIPHPLGTVIAAEKIGKNCSIIHSVTIGMRKDWKFPEIGDNVYIGAGARILGGIGIGDGAVIGANAVVIHDVPAGKTAVGIPARVVSREGNFATEFNEQAEVI